MLDGGRLRVRDGPSKAVEKDKAALFCHYIFV